MLKMMRLRMKKMAKVMTMMVQRIKCDKKAGVVYLYLCICLYIYVLAYNHTHGQPFSRIRLAQGFTSARHCSLSEG